MDIFLDADETIDAMYNYETIHLLFKFLEMLGKYESTYYTPRIIEKECDQEYLDIPRILHNNSDLYFYGCVHEEIRSNHIKDIVAIPLNIIIHHDGYIFDKNNAHIKLKRNLYLLDKMIDEEPYNLRWQYFKIRDGFHILNKNEIRYILFKNLKINNHLPISSANIIKNEYTFSFLQILSKCSIEENDFPTLNIATSIMNDLIPNNSDSIYYSNLGKLMKIKNIQSHILKNILNYRCTHFETQPKMMSTEGLHIDLLIAIMLFDIGDFKKSKKYFDFLAQKLKDVELYSIIEKYSNILNNNEL